MNDWELIGEIGTVLKLNQSLKPMSSDSETEDGKEGDDVLGVRKLEF